MTFNFVSAPDLENYNDFFGSTWGVSRQPEWDGMNGRGGKRIVPPAFSNKRLGYGLERMDGLGDTTQFGFDWPREQRSLGPVFSYALAHNLRFPREPTLGHSDLSDPLVLRMGLDYRIGNLLGRRDKTF